MFGECFCFSTLVVYPSKTSGYNQLYTIDYSKDGNLLSTAGKDKYVRIYDEQTKATVLKMKEGENLCGHSNRIFCTKWAHISENILASGGWDNTVQVAAACVHASLGVVCCCLL